ncbi:hypothetical protein DFQ26_008844, partial [Actinomortierella ambigua]
SIPLYEKERQKMAKDIHDLEITIQRDEQWRLQTKETVQRVCRALQGGLACRSTTWKDTLPSESQEDPSSATSLNPKTLEELDDSVGKAILAALQYLRGMDTNAKVDSDDDGDKDPAAQHEKESMDEDDDDEESPIDIWLKATAQAIDEDKQEKQQRARQSTHHQLFALNPDMGSTILTINELASSKIQARVETGLGLQQMLHPAPNQKKPHQMTTTTPTTTVSKNATFAGSRESISTDLGCMLDERVYLKQHIQSLDGMLAREKEARTQAEQKHFRLAKKMAALSRGILQQVNLLTMTYAVISESATPLLFSSSASVLSSALSSSSSTHIPTPPSQLSSPSILAPSPLAPSGETASFNGPKATTTPSVASMSKDYLLQELSQMDQCMRRLRTLAADCVQVVDQESPIDIIGDPLSNNLTDDRGSGGSGGGVPTASLGLSPFTSGSSPPPRSSSLGSGSHMPTGASSMRTTSGGGTPGAAFVDGISFQEFKDYLVAVCNIDRELNIVPSKSLTTTAAGPVLRPTRWTAFMARVLEEDIKPCLLMPSRSHSSSSSSTRVGGGLTGSSTSFSRGWMRLLGSSHQQPHVARPPLQNGSDSSQGSGGGSGGGGGRSSFPSSLPAQVLANLGPWHQRLLEAVERNACEIVRWRPDSPMLDKTSNNSSGKLAVVASSSSSSSSSSPALSPSCPSSSHLVASTALAVPIVVTNNDQSTIIEVPQPPKATCCLCGVTRTCEFRLRMVSPLGASTTTTTTSTPKKPTTIHRSHNPNHHHHHLDDSSPSSLPLPLDRFCRDRLVAVCDFFMFLGHLRQGLLNHYCVMDLYKRELLLRRRMACARMGAIDLLG